MIREIIFKESVDDAYIFKHAPSSEVGTNLYPVHTDGLTFVLSVQWCHQGLDATVPRMKREVAEIRR